MKKLGRMPVSMIGRAAAGLLQPSSDVCAEHILQSGSLRQPNVMERLSAIEKADVLAVAAHRHFVAGDLIFGQGDPNDRIYIIESGLVRAFYGSASGDELTLAYWQSGDLIGAPNLFGGGCYVWSCRAATDTQTLSVQGAALRKLVQEIPALAVGIIGALSFKVEWLSSFVQRLGTQPVDERLASLLDTLSVLYGISGSDGAITIGAPFTHEDLAAMVGASRPWITAALARFQEQGIIRTGKRKLVILRRDLLAEIATEQRSAGANMRNVKRMGVPKPSPRD